MACVDLSITLNTPISEVCRAASAHGLQTKEWNELVWAFDALSAWSKWFTARYGESQKIVHHSNPNDPPDLSVVFESSTVGVEHTVLFPPPLGKAEAIARNMNPHGYRVIPSLSKSHTHKELVDLACNAGGHHEFADFHAEMRVAYNTLLDAIKRKVNGPAEVIVVTDKLYWGKTLEWMAAGAMKILNSVEFEALENRTVIFHCPTSAGLHFSALMRRDGEMLCLRNGIPIPPLELPA